MKTKILLPLALLVCFAAIGCGNDTGDVEKGDGTPQSSGSAGIRSSVSMGAAGGSGEPAPAAGNVIATE